MVDVDGDGKITADEFKAACGSKMTDYATTLPDEETGKLRKLEGKAFPIHNRCCA